MATSWAHDGWIKLAKGTQARLDKLADHIKEVSERLADTYQVQGKSHTPNLSQYLHDLMQALKDEQQVPIVDSANPSTSIFVRGRCPR